MRAVPAMVAMIGLGLQAQATLVVSGTSVLRGDTVKRCTLLSVVERSQAPGPLAGGTATAVTLSGAVAETPCEVQVMPGEGKEVVAVWRVALPAGDPPRLLKVRQGGREVASLATPKEAPARLECLEARTAEGVSLAWVLTRPERYKDTALWARWSRDGGATWMGSGRILPAGQVTGEVDFPTAEVGDPAGLLVEFWIPQDLQVTKVRYTLTGQ